MDWLKRLSLAGAAAVLAAVVLTGASQAATVHIDFGVTPVGGTPSYTGASLDQSTSFNFGGGLYIVNQIGGGDQSTLALGDSVSLTDFAYGTGNSGALTTNLVKTWDTGTGTFTETLTSFTANRATTNAITLVLSGTLTGPGGISQLAFALLNANQVAGPGNAINWSLTNTSFNPSTVPLPAALPLFATGLGGLGLLGWRRKKRKAIAPAG
jgi:hypothetical protein